MKKINNLLLSLVCILLFRPNTVHAHYSRIEEGDVVLKNIVRHFNGDMELKRDDNGHYYSEFIFDGNNLIVENNKGYVLINGVPKPLETMERAGITLPVYHKVNHVWNNIKLPAQFLADEFGYSIKENRLIYDEPLGIYEEDTTTATETNEKENDNETTSKPEQTDDAREESKEVIAPEEEEEETVKEDTTDTEDEEDISNENETNNEEDDNNLTDDNVEKEDELDAVPDELPDRTMSVLNSTYTFGRYFNVGSSYQEQKQYINDDNIIVLWNEVVHSNKRATLVIGKGNTVFSGLQGKLTEGVKITVSDIVGKLREYKIREIIRVPLNEANAKHSELYAKYKLDDVFIIQLQEDNQMSFHVSF